MMLPSNTIIQENNWSAPNMSNVKNNVTTSTIPRFLTTVGNVGHVTFLNSLHAFARNLPKRTKMLGLLAFCCCAIFFSFCQNTLFGFLVCGMFFAERTVLVHFKSICCCFAVFECVVIALFAFCTCQRNSDSVAFFSSHNSYLLNFFHAKNCTPYLECYTTLPQQATIVKQ